MQAAEFVEIPAVTARPAAGSPLDVRWQAVIEKVDFAFQPIVNIHTGYCFGVEALLRDVQKAGFSSIEAVFDTAHREDVLAAVERDLHRKAARKFALLGLAQKIKLFLNIDNRALADRLSEPDHLAGDAGLPEWALALEVSERHPLGTPDEAAEMASRLRQSSFRLAIDDFGTGFSGLQLLYSAEPDLIKIDRFFIADIANDGRKKLFVSNIVNIAHLLGIQVVAEGVETEQEFFVCKDIGCDLVQGYLVQRPTTDLGALSLAHPHIEALSRRERRASSDQKIILDQIEVIDPIQIDSEMLTVFERFRSDKGATFFPVVDEAGAPVGIVRERDLKDYTYSLYGKALISNKVYGRKLRQFLSRCPICDLNMKAEKILEVFSTDQNSEGIIIVQDMRYVGFLSAHSLLRVINEKNLAVARDQNPLTKLPGNTVILEYVSEALADAGTRHHIAYLDFDNFKPFNDKYGFRLGDRAILLFAELLSKMVPANTGFIGHVGGDDFFAGFRDMEFNEVRELIGNIVERFGHDVESFYDEEARRAGYIAAADREGNLRRYPLLGVSAALLEMPADRHQSSAEELSLLIADLKKGAKFSDDHVCAAAVASSLISGANQNPRTARLSGGSDMVGAVGIEPTTR